MVYHSCLPGKFGKRISLLFILIFEYNILLLINVVLLAEVDLFLNTYEKCRLHQAQLGPILIELK